MFSALFAKLPIVAGTQGPWSTWEILGIKDAGSYMVDRLERNTSHFGVERLFFSKQGSIDLSPECKTGFTDF